MNPGPRFNRHANAKKLRAIVQGVVNGKDAEEAQILYCWTMWTPILKIVTIDVFAKYYNGFNLLLEFLHTRVATHQAVV